MAHTSGQMTCAADFGNGRQADMELQEHKPLWVAVGPGIPLTDVWMKAAPGGVDLRVRIQRTEGGIQISADRGEHGAAWWPTEAVPRLEITVDQNAGTASASASVGVDDQFQEVLLGQTAI